jgi:hypothetical protein
MKWIIAILVLLLIIEIFGNWYERDAHKYLDNKEKEHDAD